MGTLSTNIQIESHTERGRRIEIPQALVDTGSEHTWAPAAMLEQIGIVREKKDLHFVMANGEQITRSVGFAIVHAENTLTIDEVVFAEPGDQMLLGARTLGGLNLTVDAERKKLVAAGPLPAA